MNKDNKYYTPDLSEFYVGFEYEFFNNMTDKIWKKEICDVDSISIAYDSFEHGSKEWNDSFEDTFRVKYLDVQDIEELGWVECSPRKHNGEIDYYPGRILFRKKRTYKELPDYEEYYYLDYCEEYQAIEIDNGGSYEDRDTYFQGTVKNKSELKILLQQLGIE